MSVDPAPRIVTSPDVLNGFRAALNTPAGSRMRSASGVMADAAMAARSEQFSGVHGAITGSSARVT